MYLTSNTQCSGEFSDEWHPGGDSGLRTASEKPLFNPVAIFNAYLFLKSGNTMLQQLLGICEGQR
jgi:hypothetical protein